MIFGRTIIHLAVLIVAATSLKAQNVPTEIKLTNGFVMHGCTVVRWTPDTITVQYVGGIVPVKIANIDPSQRPLFENGVADGLKNQAMHDQHVARNQAEHADRDRERAEGDAAKQAEADEKAEKIAHGVTWHYLVVGMTGDQVRQAIGGPTSTSPTYGDTNYDYWKYAARGKGVDAYGNPKDLHLFFRDGLLVSWSEY